MADGLKVGDTVRLKSGGPAMTITELGTLASGGQLAYCTWFATAESKEPSSGKFPGAALQDASTKPLAVNINFGEKPDARFEDPNKPKEPNQG